MADEREALARYAATGYWQDKNKESQARINLESASDRRLKNWNQAFTLQVRLVNKEIATRGLTVCAFLSDGHPVSRMVRADQPEQDKEAHWSDYTPLQRLAASGVVPVEDTSLMFIQPRPAASENLIGYHRMTFDDKLHELFGHLITSESIDISAKSKFGGIYRVCKQIHTPSVDLYQSYQPHFENGEVVTRFAISEIVYKDGHYKTIFGDDFDIQFQKIAAQYKDRNPILSGQLGRSRGIDLDILNHFEIPDIPPFPDDYSSV